MHGALAGFREATVLNRSDFFPRPHLEAATATQANIKNISRRKQTHSVSCFLLGPAGIAALCSGVGAVKGAALGHHRQNKPAPRLRREGRFFFNDESKIIKERDRGSCTTPHGGSVTMGVSVFFHSISPASAHLGTDVFKRGWTHEREANEENILMGKDRNKP